MDRLNSRTNFTEEKINQLEGATSQITQSSHLKETEIQNKKSTKSGNWYIK